MKFISKIPAFVAISLGLALSQMIFAEPDCANEISAALEDFHAQINSQSYGVIAEKKKEILKILENPSASPKLTN